MPNDCQSVEAVIVKRRSPDRIRLIGDEPALSKSIEIGLNPAGDGQQLLAQVVDYYHHTLKHVPEALDYLRRRGIADSAAIDTFRIGYTARSLDLTLPSKQFKAGKAIRTAWNSRALHQRSRTLHRLGGVSDLYG